MKLPILNASHVVAKQLCCGCGVCSYLQPEQYRMVDVPDMGKRPIAANGGCARGESAKLSVCPGINLTHTFDRNDPELLEDLVDGWGPVYEVWEGHADDADVRYSGSSGGVATALALFAISTGAVHGVLHTGARPDAPYLNRTVFSRTREDILATTGSRYSPASPCDGLAQVESAPGPCLFIGKPCDVAAVHAASAERPRLEVNLALTIALFCAGTPSTKGTMELLKKVGINDPTRVTGIRYRGEGWPGQWTVSYTDADGCSAQASMTYEESWGFLQRFRQWRCYVCPDHTGEFADIAVGDPWHKAPGGEELGSSLILVRTRRGRAFLAQARAAGAVSLSKAPARRLRDSQPNLLAARGAMWGRLLALRVMGVSCPTFVGFPMFRYWLSELGWSGKKGSILGTVKRVFTKGLWKAMPVIMPGEPVRDQAT